MRATRNKTPPVVLGKKTGGSGRWCQLLSAGLLLPTAILIARPAMAEDVCESDACTRVESAETPADANEETNGLHAGISHAVERAAKRVDAFFSDDRLYADATETYVRLSAQTTLERGEEDKSQARVRLRLDLPGTRERWRLFVEGEDPDATGDAGSDSIPQAFDDSDYNVGLEARLPNTGRWNVLPGAGAKAASPPDPFVRLRAIRYERLRLWLFRFSIGAAEFLDDGTELFTRFDLDRRLDDDWLFRSTSRARYLDRKDRIEVTQQFSLFQRLGSRVGLAYDIGARVDDDPDWEVDHYYTQVRTRIRAYRKWLFVELAPGLIFREEDDFDPNLRFSLRTDVVFGERYL